MKRIQLFVFIFLIVQVVNSRAQIPEPEWAKQSGVVDCDFYTDVIEDANSGFTVTGALKQKGNSFDFQVIHFDKDGKILWEKITGTPAKEIPKRITQLNNKSYVILGTSADSSTQSNVLLRLDTEGNEIWRKTLNSEYLAVEDIISLEENNFAVVGAKRENPESSILWMAIFDENGEITRENNFMPELMGCAKSLKKLPNGDFAITGQVNEPGKNNCDIVAIRAGNKGKARWISRVKTPGQRVWPECICCSPDSSFMIVGWNGKCLGDINAADPVFDFDLVLNKIDGNGKILWTKSIDREGSEGGNALTIRPDGTFIVAGIKATSFLGKVGPWLLSIDPDGNELAEKLLSLHFKNDHASRIINSSDGSFIVIGPGIQEETNNRSDGWIVKFGTM